MADNKLNLVLAFNAVGIEKLSAGMKNLVGLGKSSAAELRDMNRELGRARSRFRELDTAISQGKLTDSIRYRHELAKQEVLSAEALITRKKNLMEIESRTQRMQAAGSAMAGSGMSTLMWGAMAAAPIVAMARSAGEIEGLTNRLRVLGLGDRAARDLRAYADAMNVAGSSVQDNMRYLVEAQGVFRESGSHNLAEQLSGAKLMAPMMARLMTTSKALGHELTEDQERSFLRFVEQAGGVNDPRRAAALTDGLFRAIQSSGGNVDPSNYQAFMARAGTAGMRLSARSMFADMEPLIAELHESAGVGLQSAYARMNGMVKNSAGAAELLRLGVWDRNAVQLNNLGGVKRFIGGRNPLNAGMADQLATSPVDFYMQLRDRYAKAGIKDVQRENMLLFGRTGGQLFNLIEKQLPTILKSRAAYQQAQGLDQAYNTTKDSFFGQTGQMTAAWKNFMVAAGTRGGLLQGLTNGLRAATGALQVLTGAANAHPTAFRWIATTVTGLLGMKLAGAALKVVFGTLLGPVATLWGWWSKYRELGSIAAMFPMLARAAGFLRVAILMLGQGFLRAGMLMLANPMVLIITGIVVAIGLLGYAVYRNWGTIRAAFSTGWAWLSARLTAMKQYFAGLGPMLMAGLVNALDPFGLARRLLQIAKTGVTAFMNYFGIHSPSRLMFQMGGHLATGLGMGIDHHAHRPLRSLDRLAHGMTTSFNRAAPAGGTRGGGTTINHFHIHQRPGENGEAFAHRVVRIIDHHTRADRGRDYQDDF
jgi:hypothetical protein